MLIRFILYGLGGWCGEVIWTAVGERVTRRQTDWTLHGTTYLWMFPLYGSLAIFYEPLHDAIRDWNILARALIYMLGFFTAEYIAGWLLRKLIGVCPWDYSRITRYHVHGYINPTYAPVWALIGLGLEPVHDFLVRLTPLIMQAVG